MKNDQFYPCYRVKSQEGLIGCAGELSGILTGAEIKKWGLIEKEGLEEKDCLKGTSYDLRLGEGHYLYIDGEWKLFYLGDDIESVNLDIAKPHQFNYQAPANIMELTIAPFSTALIQLHETVDTLSAARDMSVLVAGRFDLRVSMVIKGIVSQQATQVEPCYKGKLFCFLYNNTGNAIVLKHLERIATIEFYYISCLEIRDDEKRDTLIKDMIIQNKEKYNNRPFCFNNGIKDTRYFAVSRSEEIKLHKGGGLATFEERFNKLSKQLSEKMSVDSFLPEIEKKLTKNIVTGLEIKKNKWAAIFPLIGAFIIALGGFILNDVLGKKKDAYLKEFDDKSNEVIKIIEEKEEASLQELQKIKDSILLEAQKKLNEKEVKNE